MLHVNKYQGFMLHVNKYQGFMLDFKGREHDNMLHFELKATVPLPLYELMNPDMIWTLSKVGLYLPSCTDALVLFCGQPTALALAVKEYVLHSLRPDQVRLTSEVL